MEKHPSCTKHISAISHQLETDPCLLEYRKIADQERYSNNYYNLNKYQFCKGIIQSNPSLNQIANLFLKEDNFVSKENTTTDTATSDATTGTTVNNSIEIQQSPTQNPINNQLDEKCMNHGTAVEDLAFAIKEQLLTTNVIDEDVIKNLEDLPKNEVEHLFVILSETLSTDDIVHLGNALKSSVQREIVESYCHYLLVSQVGKEYSENLSKLLTELSQKGFAISNEFVKYLSDGASKSVSQYITCLNREVKTSILRDFILVSDYLTISQMEIMETLLCSELEYGVLKKLISLLLNSNSGDLNNSVKMGKFLVRLVQLAGPNLVQLERPFKQLISTHQSIWKLKLEKTFENCLEVGLMLSQSLACTQYHV